MDENVTEEFETAGIVHCSLLVPMVVLAPGSVHAGPFAQPPIDTSGNLSAHMSAKSPSKIILKPSVVISEGSEP